MTAHNEWKLTFDFSYIQMELALILCFSHGTQRKYTRLLPIAQRTNTNRLAQKRLRIHFQIEKCFERSHGLMQKPSRLQ